VAAPAVEAVINKNIQQWQAGFVEVFERPLKSEEIDNSPLPFSAPKAWQCEYTA
jgi:hypothetical protein